MLLSRLLSKTQTIRLVNFADVEISGVYNDSGQVKSGGLFICQKGCRFDGHDFAAAAVKNGAVCVVAERELPLTVPVVVVPDARAAEADIAAEFYGRAAEKLKIICVVGTNGKTSTAFITEKILSSAGKKTALISTNGIYILGEYRPNEMTTPRTLTLHRLFAEMAEKGVEYCVMEMSAHAIALDKLRGVTAELAVFTNFSRDHLDYFGDMESYRGVKKSFFTSAHARAAVLNADDETGRQIARETDLPFVTYGIDNPADAFAVNVDCEGEKTSYFLNVYDEVEPVNSALTGRFNVYNTLAAATACRVLGIKPHDISHGISEIKFIEGRCQTVVFAKGFRVVVDYAHTPDGIKNVLAHLKASTFGRLIVVYGCGGERDKTKRPLMGEAVSEYADYAFVTSDNPRGEDPFEIMFQTEKGLSVAHRLVCDRRAAITGAVYMAEKDDVVAVLGKGHEKYQEINGAKYPFGDMDVVLELAGKDSAR